MINVVIVDDHSPVRQALRRLLSQSGDIHVIGEAADGQEAVDCVKRLAPDVVVMDISMPRMDGIQATEQISAFDRAINVLIISMYNDAALMKKALDKGARGYLSKSNLYEQLPSAVRAVHKGEIYLAQTGKLGQDRQ
jgi:DNA-binding NarL/FixJ family response regulator